MVVMETVKAATLATAKKLEKLAEEQRKNGSCLMELMYNKCMYVCSLE